MTPSKVFGCAAVGFGVAFPYLYFGEKRFSNYQKLDSKIDLKVRNVAERMGIKEDFRTLVCPPDKSSFHFDSIFFGTPMIALNTGVPFVIAHELAHLKCKHPRKEMIFSSISWFGFCAAAIATRKLPSSRLKKVFELSVPTFFILAASFGRDRLRVAQEEEADLVACRYLDSDEIAGGIHFFNQSMLETEMEENALKHGPILTRWKWKMSMLLDDHPSTPSRIDALIQEFNKQVRSCPLPVEIKGELKTTRLLSIEESDVLRDKIAKSTRGILLVNFKSIQLCPGSEKNNLIFLVDGLQRSYSVTPSLVNDYVRQGTFDVMCALVEEVIQSRPCIFINFSAKEYALLSREEVITDLQRKAPDMDWDQVEVSSREDGVVIFKAYEKRSEK